MAPRVIILGSGTPTPHTARWGTSFLVGIGGEGMMFDCGFAATYKLAQAGFMATQVDNLFFTHHHSDHDADYPSFLLTRFDMSIGKENQLNVYGPTLTEQLTERLLGEGLALILFDHPVPAALREACEERRMRVVEFDTLERAVEGSDYPGRMRENCVRITAALARE